MTKSGRSNEGIIINGGTLTTNGAVAVCRNARASSIRTAPAAQQAKPPSATMKPPEEIRSPYAQEWDAFVSHASEDKDFVEPLALALIGRGLKIWYDNVSLRVGNSLREAIDFGIVKSHFGIVVLSPHYFAKDWTRQEVNGMFGREIGGVRVMLPIWHHVTYAEVVRFSPILADRIAVRSSEGIDTVVERLLRSMESIGKATES